MDKKKISIACAIPDNATFNLIKEVFLYAGFNFERFNTETELLRTLRRRSFDLVIVDTGTAPPVKTQILSWLSCHTGKATPVILLAAASSPEQVANALDAGADEFISKPFSPVEFGARVKAVLRRCDHRHLQRTVSIVGFTLDQEASRVLDRGIPVDLTPREFTMAWLLFSSPGLYLSRETISTAIWGVGSEIAGRTIEQHIYKLRKKLKLSEERGAVIRTAYTQGYRLELTLPDNQDERSSNDSPKQKQVERQLAYA